MSSLSVSHLIIGLITLVFIITKAIFSTLLKIGEIKESPKIKKSHYDLLGSIFWIFLLISILLGFASIGWSFIANAHIILLLVYLGIEILLILMSPLFGIVFIKRKLTSESNETEKESFSPVNFTLAKDWFFATLFIVITILGFIKS